MIKGVGPDEPIESDANGYNTSKTPYRFDLMPGAALLHMAEIMGVGAETHGADNWRNGSVASHLNKAAVHLFAHLAGDTQDDHIGHFAWRAMAALEIHLSERSEQA